MGNHRRNNLGTVCRLLSCFGGLVVLVPSLAFPWNVLAVAIGVVGVAINEISAFRRKA
jgi:hypothetical protein